MSLVSIPSRYKVFVSKHIDRILGIGVIAFLVGGATMVGLREYGAACVFWLLAVLAGARILWPSPERSLLRVFVVLGGILAFAFLLIWTVASKGEEPWSNLSRFWVPAPKPSPVPAADAVKKPPDKLTLYGLFKSEFPNTVKLTQEKIATHFDKRTGVPDPPYRFSFQLYLDYSSRSKFIGFYLPSDIGHMEHRIIEVARSHRAFIAEMEKEVWTQAGNAGDEPQNMKDLVFTGQCFLYYEDILSPLQKTRVIDVYKRIGLNPQFRGQDHLMWHELYQKQKD